MLANISLCQLVAVLLLVDVPPCLLVWKMDREAFTRYSGGVLLLASLLPSDQHDEATRTAIRSALRRGRAGIVQPTADPEHSADAIMARMSAEDRIKHWAGVQAMFQDFSREEKAGSRGLDLRHPDDPYEYDRYAELITDQKNGG